MKTPAEDLVLRLRQEELERIQARPPEPSRRAEQPTIPHTQLPEGAPDSPLTTEWNVYRRIIGRLLAEGHEGKWLLIKHEEIVGIWNAEAEADTVRRERFLMQPVLMKQILSQEPILRIGYNRLCLS